MLSVTDAAGQRFDRRSVYDFCEALSAQAGMSVTVLSHPEDDPSHLLKVDALLDIDGEVWALDHVRLVYDRQLIPANSTTSKTLSTPPWRSSLNTTADPGASDPPAGSSPAARHPGRAGRRARESEKGAFVARIVALAEQALTTGQDRFLHEGITTVRLALQPNPSGQRVDLLAWGSAGPWIEAQVTAGLADSLRSKLSDLLARAKQAGYPVMLLIDQVQDPDSRQPSQFLAGAWSVSPLVDQVMQERPGVLDSVWFRDRKMKLHRLV